MNRTLGFALIDCQIVGFVTASIMGKEILGGR
jgi:hypothetical protein